MEDKAFPAMVVRQQKIGLLAPGIVLGIVFRVSAWVPAITVFRSAEHSGLKARAK